MKILGVLKFFSVAILLTAMTFSGAFARADGPANGGGGNTVGDKLFDDYENQGTEQIPATEIARLAAPVLNDLDGKVPSFAKRLRQGITGIVWYKEPKLLDQTGICRNGSETGLTPPIQQVVRACQNKLNVRIDKEWYEAQIGSPTNLVPDLVIHELLVYQRIRSPKLTEEAVLHISRDIRSMKLSATQIQSDLQTDGFGDYATKAQFDQFTPVWTRALKAGKSGCGDTLGAIDGLLASSDEKFLFGSTMYANPKLNPELQGIAKSYWDRFGGSSATCN